MFASFLSPILDLLQFAFNFAFFWAPSAGISIPDAHAMFGGLLGASG
jgi:hypothetical protein